MYYILNYDYVADIITKREPYRSEHLGILKTYQQADQLLLAGATGDPVAGATFVFKVSGRDKVQEFVDSDPYVANGLVSQISITPWTVVVGSAHQNET